MTVYLSFILELSPSSGIMCTGSRYSGFGVGVFHYCTTYYIPGTKPFSFKSQNIFMFSTGSVVLHSDHLMYLLMMNLLVSGLYNFYVYPVRVSAYLTMISLCVLSFICLLIFSLFVTYAILPKSENNQ